MVTDQTLRSNEAAAYSLGRMWVKFVWHAKQEILLLGTWYAIRLFCKWLNDRTSPKDRQQFFIGLKAIVEDQQRIQLATENQRRQRRTQAQLLIMDTADVSRSIRSAVDQISMELDDLANNREEAFIDSIEDARGELIACRWSYASTEYVYRRIVRQWLHTHIDVVESTYVPCLSSIERSWFQIGRCLQLFLCRNDIENHLSWRSQAEFDRSFDHRVERLELPAEFPDEFEEHLVYLACRERDIASLRPLPETLDGLQHALNRGIAH